MPFSRYQLRNEYSLADPELYKAADKDDPEALLEGVAMAGLVGVLRQLGDLAEFAAEIFRDLHEEVMVTAARGHGMLVRVQQLESEFPSIERAFLCQTSHSAFFSSSGIGWHPNLQTEQNLITRGDLPRFVMDSYEECRGPPRLFLLDKFDVAGAGACLKRYTDPSFYKMEASVYEMTSAEAQRDKKSRKTKKKGSRWKNGETLEVLQPSHVKLHQLLLEERVQSGASEPARRVKLKKRQNKFPFVVESGKGYMEKLLSSPLEDKLVHEVPHGSSLIRLPTNNSGGLELEVLEVSVVGSPLGSPRQNRSPYESPSVDKTVSREHVDNISDDIAESPIPELPNSGLSSEARVVYSGLQEEVDEKHISVGGESKADGIQDDYQSDDVGSEADNYVDALATIESEIETDAVLRANSDPSIKHETYSDTNAEQLRSQFSDSQSASDDESSSIRKKVTSFSYSDTTSTSADNTSPGSVLSPQPFACTEIPFRPRVSPDQVSVNCIDVSDISVVICDPDVKLSEASFSGDIRAAEEIACSLDTCSLPEGQLKDDLPERKSDPAEVGVSHSSEDEIELNDRETVSVDSETKVATAAVCDPADDRNRDDSLPTLGDEKELEERETESVISETKDVTTAVSVPDDVDHDESKDLPTCEDDTELERREVESVDSETEATSAVPVPGGLEKNEDNGLSSLKEPGENGLAINELGVVQNSNESGEKKDSSEQSVISLELDSIPSASYDHSDIQFLDSVLKSSPDTCGYVNENDVDNPSANLEILQDESHFIIVKRDQNGLQTNVAPDVDFQTGNDSRGDQSNAKFLDSAPNSPVLTEVQKGLHLDVVTAVSSSSERADQDLESKSPNQIDHINELEAALSISSHSVPIEEKDDQPHIERVDSQNRVDHEMHDDTHSEPYPVNHESYSLEQIEKCEGDVESTTSVVATSESTFQCSVPVSEELYVSELPQSSSRINLSDQVEYRLAPVFSGFGSLPQLAPINLEEMPPLPPLPPMQWRMGNLQNASLTARPDGSRHTVDHFPPAFPQIASHPSLDRNDNTATQKSERDYEDTESSSQVLPTESREDDNLVISSEMNRVKFAEDIMPQPPFERERSQNVSTSGREIFWPSSTSSLPPVDDERPNGIRPMKIQRPRTPLIDAVAAHDKSKLRKVSERAGPQVPKEDERDTLLEQIRMKSFNLKPSVQTRPSIQGPTTNLRVAAILEKANAIRQSLAGSDDDEDDDDSWSDS